MTAAKRPPMKSRQLWLVPFTRVTFVVRHRRGSALVVTRHVTGDRAGQTVTHSAEFFAECRPLTRFAARLGGLLP